MSSLAVLEPRWRIDICDLRCETIVGVYEHERTKPQQLDVSASLWFSGKVADSHASTLCYDHVSSRMLELVEQSSYLLIETLADALALDVIKSHTRVERVVVSVRKHCELAGGAYPRVSVVRVRSGTSANASSEQDDSPFNVL